MNMARLLAAVLVIPVISWFAAVADCRAQDFDQDGIPDYVDAMVVAPGGTVPGVVTVRSGTNNAVLLQIEATEPDNAFGWDFEILPDLNGDGVPDVAVAAPRSHLWTDAIGRVFVYSGATGEQLFTLRGRRGDRIGFALGGSHDVNADGVPDIFASGMRLDPIGIPVERHFWFSGATGELLFDQSYPHPGLKPVILEPLSVWGDLNQDNELDLFDVIELDTLVQQGAPPQDGGDLNQDLSTDDLDLDMMIESVIAGEPVIAAEDRLLSAADWGDLGSVLATWSLLYPEDPITATLDPAHWSGGNAVLDYWQNGRFTVSGQSIVAATTQTVCDVDPIVLGQRAEGIATAGCPDCNAQVQITSAPEIIRLGEPFTVHALWGSDCDERYWIVHFGTMTVGPIEADTLEYQIDFFEGSETDVIIKAVCVDTEGNCAKIATVTIPFADCALDLSGCPWEVYGGEQITLTATAVPPGGTFTWTLTDESCYVASVSQRDSTFQFTLRESPTCNPRFGVPLFVTAIVTYELNGCVKQKVCIFSIRFDTDGDGLFDEEESGGECPFGFAADSDGDGVNDGDEIAAGLNPCSFDSDGDGANDGCEIRYGTVVGDKDEDHDRLTGAQECGLGTDPRKWDTDGDGLSDGVEVGQGWDPLDPDDPPGARDDTDNDGLVDYMEAIFGTDPLNPDTDGDGLLDGYEARGMSCIDPLNPDSDGDGLSDGDEVIIHGTSPCGYDTDGDGLSDGFEIFSIRSLLLNPLSSDSDSNGTLDGDEDFDADGLSNRDEQLWGTDPLEADTDGDGIVDGIEAVAGDPTNPEVVGARDREQTYEVSVSASPNGGEGSWSVQVGPRHLGSTGFGGSINRTVRLSGDGPHDAKLVYAGTEPLYFADNCLHDFDYCFNVSPATDEVVVEDVSGLLGCKQIDETYDSYESNPAKGKKAKIWRPRVDVDIDSDNDDGLSNPSRSSDEDEAEMSGYGKIMFASLGDQDSDGIPDYADGFNLDEASSTISEYRDNESEGVNFIPVVVELKDFPPGELTITVSYPASDPNEMAADGSYVPAEGVYRLWRSKSPSRDKSPLKEGGDYIAPGSYTESEWGATGKRTFYLEAVRTDASTHTIAVSATSTGGGGSRSDSVRVTPVAIQYVPVERGPLGQPLLGTPTQVLPVSHPTPTIDLANRVVMDPRPDPLDASKLIADIILNGSVDDAMSDLSTSWLGFIPTGTIDSIEITLNKGADSERSFTQSMNVVKNPGTGGIARVLDPYDYTGSFATVLSGVEVQPGWNTIEIRAMNDMGHVGVLSFGFRINLTLPDEIDEPLSYEDYDIAVGQYSDTRASGGGIFSPFLIEVLMPGSVAEAVDTLEYGSQSYHLVSYGGRIFASVDINETMTPRALVAIPSAGYETPSLTQLLEDQFGTANQMGQAAFLRGVGAGVIDTGVGVWDGFVSIAEGGWYLARHYNPVTTNIRMKLTGSPLRVEDQQRILAAAGLVERIAPILWELVKDGDAAIEAVLTGDHDTLNQLGEEYAVYLEIAYEIIDELKGELATMNDYEAGRLVGRVAAEVALAVGPGLAGVAVKSVTMVSAASKIKQGALAAKYGDRIIDAMERVPVRAAAIATSGMCFVAGTLVHTNEGLVPIEQVQVGDMVLSRHHETGAQLYKRVVNTITTHPSELYVIESGIDADGDGTADSVESLTTTAEHPFYVQSLGAFIPAAELEAGHSLLLADGTGTTAFVTDIQVQRGPPASGSSQHGWNGASYTTYNFEVEDFHTYFVSASGVWVHNQGREVCERLFALYLRYIDRTGGDRVAAATQLIARLDTMLGKSMDSPAMVTAVHMMMDDMYAAATAGPDIDLSQLMTCSQASIAMRGHLLSNDLEVHHSSTQQWTNRLFFLQFNRYPTPEEMHSMPALITPRTLHNFGVSHAPNMPTIHDIIAARLGHDPSLITNKDEIIDGLRQAYNDIDMVWGSQAGMAFDYRRVWISGRQWLLDRGID
ncbi:MAG: Hint domain-containing protein [Phycisphaeraceae bacterium]|nr:MAG: Hint domain-containing protein [Phycisphaeraceae bacterium]